jgi:hypothetical protein
MARPFDIEADLDLVVDGEAVTVEGTGDTIVIDVSSLDAAQHLLNTAPLQGRSPRERITRASNLLRTAGLTAEVRMQGDTIARIGADAQAGSIGRLLNLPDVEVRAGSTVRKAVRQRPGWTLGLAAALSALVAALWFWRSRD